MFKSPWNIPQSTITVTVNKCIFILRAKHVMFSSPYDLKKSFLASIFRYYTDVAYVVGFIKISVKSKKTLYKCDNYVSGKTLRDWMGHFHLTGKCTLLILDYQ